MIINTKQLHSTSLKDLRKTLLKFYTGSNPALGVQEVCDNENLRKLSWLETSQKNFVIIIIINIIIITCSTYIYIYIKTTDPIFLINQIFWPHNYPANIYLFKINDRNTRKRCNMFKVNNKNNRMTSMTSFWCFYC